MIENDSITFADLDEFLKKRQNYWELLKKIIKDYSADINAVKHQFDVDDLGVYVERNYGIKIHTVDGNVTDKFDIIDEKLYVLCILRYT